MPKAIDPENPMDRNPSTYKEEYIEAVDKYLKSKKDDEYKFHKTVGVSNTYEEKVKVHLPTIKDFALNFLKVTRKTVYNWADEHPDFKDALDKILAEQEQRVLEGGLSGTYNANIARLILTTNHLYRDRIDATSKGDKINAFNDEQIDRIATRIASGKTGDGDTSSK